MSATTHFIGIGGTGLSAIARVLLERGAAVSGSDREDSSLAQALRTAGATVHIGHAAVNVNGATQVVRSSAVGEDNVEVQAARAKGLPVYKRAEFLGQLLADQQVIAVAGSHGKTTTTAMLAWVLTALNRRPGYIIGSPAANLGGNAAAGAGRLFVVEADEYDYMFLGLSPQLALVTNVEHDHPDMFPSAESFMDAFRQFVGRIVPGGLLLACADDPGARQLGEYAASKGIEARYYAHSHSEASYRARNLTPQEGQGYRFEALLDGQPLAEVSLAVPGLHNAQNALGALAAAHELGLDPAEAALALGDFRGTARRFELRGEAGGVLLVDDYAHHPTEIRSALAAAKARYPGRRLVAVWQPHTFSRTNLLRAEFAAAFGDAGQVLVTDVYAAREQQPEGFDLDGVVGGIQHPAAELAGDLDATTARLTELLQPGDVLLVMSAGDAVSITERIFRQLQEKENDHA
ncbi:MAG: UDP-N-acetylmuramate--L-alanine ligase [Anaerolineales bacterium]|nr:UDP-N-acetylmuramate--L-alanine ligase [Anaerolineales bacterium]